MTPAAPALDAGLKRKLLMTVLESRHGDLREESLNRQGKGHFQVSGRGHEAVAAFGMLLHPDDHVCPYYRDRALVLGRGVTTRQLALDYMAKRESSSHGRQMPAHFSFPEYHIWSVPTPTASQLLPACGMAWGMKLDGKQDLALTTVGDAATRQGDFYEAIAFAKERKLPLVLVVEDNGYGISSPTRHTNPLALNVLAAEDWIVLEGWEVERVYLAAAEAMARVRAGGGPAFIWIRMERLSSHTSTDDQKVYRSAQDLATFDDRDPLKVMMKQLCAEGIMTREEFDRLDQETKERVRADYTAAEGAENPSAGDLEANLMTTPPELDGEIFKAGKYRMGDMINLTLRAGLEADPRRVIFGEDVEDPKGGVFTLTKKLSTDHPGQVFNSPLAESTILGVACGLASYGRRPVFELQFIDFIYPGWNQLMTNLATLRWRSNGKWTCPAVIYAPYGAYLPGGSLWHSQANESAIAHFPGLNVVIPSTPEDAAGLLWTAMHTEDPTIFLIPKHMLWVEREIAEPVSAVPIGHARVRAEGGDVTVVAWGNTVEKSLEAIHDLHGEASVELIDLRSVAPWDRELIEQSVRKTGRLVVVQEDTENCSVGQMIISHLMSRPDVWSRMIAPPVLVSKGNVMIGFNPIYEFAALPDSARVVEAVRRVVAVKVTDRAGDSQHVEVIEAKALRPPPHEAQPAVLSSEFIIKMPVMGEGIRAARIVALFKKPGERVALDDAFCDVETDKAVYPVESSHAGTFKEWLVKVDDVVEIGRDIAVMTLDAPVPTSPPAALPPSLQQLQKGGGTGVPARESSAGLPARGAPGVPPALAPAIVKRLGAVIPANMQMHARWQAIRAARATAKKEGREVSPSLMLAWCVARAMTAHPAFRRMIDANGRIEEKADFDLGIAVSLPGDQLATAAIHKAGKLEWKDFVAAYSNAVAATRAGSNEEVQAPLNITSLGAFGVEQAVPIVVPPSMATLFIGTAHERMIDDDGSVYPVEVVTLSLTFDHRVVNGVGAAAFARDVCAQIEGFKLPPLA